MRRKLVKEIPLIASAYQKGMTLKELSDFHQTTPTTIRSILKEAGVTIRRRGPRSKAKFTVEQEAATAVNSSEQPSDSNVEVSNGVQQPSL
jgi:arsenate reductase-like glutaredoxin family protein